MAAHINRLVLFMPECTFLSLIYKNVELFAGTHLIIEVVVL
jgi:hypothetical protein